MSEDGALVATLTEISRKPIKIKQPQPVEAWVSEVPASAAEPVPEMPTNHDTSWVRVGAVSVGDRVRVPGFSSWSGWASRADAERSDQPFRVVERIELGWERTSRTRLVFADGYACQLAPDAFVLRRVAERVAESPDSA